jgi:hypothetical protein
MLPERKRSWMVTIVEADGSETKDTYQQTTAGEAGRVHKPREIIDTAGGRQVVIDEIEPPDPKSGTVGTIRAHPFQTASR